MHEPAGIAVEPPIGLFQAAAASFDEEVVDQRHPGQVDDGVDQVVAPFEVLDARRGGLDDDVVPEPVAGGCWSGVLVRGMEVIGRMGFGF